MKERLLFLGDLIFGDGPVDMGYGFDSIHKKDGYENVFLQVKPYLMNYKHVIANFESIIGVRPDYPNINNWSMCCDERICKQLANANINIVSLANNHSMDYGPELFNYTKDKFKEYGIKVIGLKEKPYEILEVNSDKVGLVGISYIHNNKKYQPGFFYDPDDNDLSSLVSEIKCLQYKVAYVHWGNEFVSVPTVIQVKTASKLIEHGFDTVIGSHPHITQRSYYFDSSLVCFSLGNFVSAYKQKRLRKSIAVAINFKDRTFNEEIHFYIDNKGVPIFTGSNYLKSEPFDNVTSSALSIIFERFRIRVDYLLFIIINFHKVNGKVILIKWLLRRLKYLVKHGLRELKEPDTVYKYYE